MRGRLSMVVAFVLNVRIHGRVSVYLLLPLLCHQAADRGYRVYVPLLWVHAHHGLFVLLAHRIDWLLCLLLVRKEDLQCREGGLSVSECDGFKGEQESYGRKIPLYLLDFLCSRATVI